MTRPVERLLDALAAAGCQPRRSGSGWSARCPGHDDKTPSLSIGEGADGRALVRCFAGCPLESIVGAVGLELPDLFSNERDDAWGEPGETRRFVERYTKPDQVDRRLAVAATYTYADEAGSPVGFVERLVDGAGNKTFRQGRIVDGQRVPGLAGQKLPLYRLHEVRAAIERGEAVWVVEGEKDADRLAGLGIPATTSPGGAGKFRPDHADALRGAPWVIVVPDNDEPGRRHAEAVAKLCSERGITVKVVELPGLPEKGDVSDWLDAGHRPEELLDLAEAAPEWRPPTKDADEVDLAPRPVVERLDSVEPERVRWLWPGYVPLGKLTLLEGDPGAGKSTLSLDLAARVSRGRPMPDGSPGIGPAGVVLLTAEDGLADTVVPRLLTAGADLARVVALRAVQRAEGGRDGIRWVEGPPILPGDLDAIERAVGDAGAALVVVDVLMAYLGGEINTHRDQDVRRALHQMAALAERTGAAVVCLRHLAKSGGANPLYRGGGSIGITGAARAVLLAGLDPDDDEGRRRVLAVSKINVGEKPPALAYELVGDHDWGAARINWLGPTAHTAADLLRAPADDEERTTLAEAANWLAGVLADGPVPRAEVLRQAQREGYSERTVKRAARRLGVVSARDPDRQGRPATWALPTTERAQCFGPRGVSGQPLGPKPSPPLTWKNSAGEGVSGQTLELGPKPETVGTERGGDEEEEVRV